MAHKKQKKFDKFKTPRIEDIGKSISLTPNALNYGNNVNDDDIEMNDELSPIYQHNNHKNKAKNVQLKIPNGNIQSGTKTTSLNTSNNKSKNKSHFRRKTSMLISWLGMQSERQLYMEKKYNNDAKMNQQVYIPAKQICCSTCLVFILIIAILTTMYYNMMVISVNIGI